MSSEPAGTGQTEGQPKGDAGVSSAGAGGAGSSSSAPHSHSAPGQGVRPYWGADYSSYKSYLKWKLGDPLSALQTLFLPLRWFTVFSTFSYGQELIRQANGKVPLEDKDFPSVEHIDSAEVLSSRILGEWHREQGKAKEDSAAGRVPRTPWWQFMWVIIRVFGVEYWWATVAAFGETVAKILEALILGAIIRWLMGGATDSSGWIWATLLSLCVIWHGFLHHWLFYLSMRCGFRMRVGFISTIYRKALRLSISHTSSTGYITNLVSNDCQRFEDAGPFAFFILLGPLEAVVSVVIIYSYIGVSSLVGFAILMLSIPLQSFFAKRFGTLRRATVIERDERIKTTSDALAGISVVKMYAWEPPMQKRISDLRDREVKHIRKASVLRALNEAMYVISPSLTSLGTFGCFWALGGIFTADKVFVTLYLFSNIRLILVGFFAKGVQFCSESSVSMTRISDFLSLPEMTNVDHDAAGDKAKLAQVYGKDKEIIVGVKDGSFSWAVDKEASKAGDAAGAGAAKPDGAKDVELKPVNGTKPSDGTSSDASSSEGDSTADAESTGKDQPGSSGGAFTLDNINLAFEKGKITAIVGPVGAGKSSLLLALLGEMSLKQGSVLVATDSIALATQSPWIVNGSIKDNIIFGKPFDEKRFNDAIELAAMTTDLQILPYGKDTMIGERGVTLSGGQRARTALARAIYADADLYLLDDPLSAVDSRVSKHLWGSLMDLTRVKGKTVILVTHQLQFVKDADRVVVMERGQISRQGTWAEIESSRLPSGELGGELRRKSFANVLRDFSKAELGNDVSVDEIAEGRDDAEGEETEKGAEEDGGKEVVAAAVEVKKEDKPAADDPAKAFVIEERQLGDLDRGVFISYFKAAGGMALTLFFFFLMCAGEANLVLCDWWLAQWSRQSPENQRNTIYISVFAGLTASNILIALTRSLMFFQMCLTASTNLFRQMLASILRAPLFFFQVNPLGRLLNRFSKDLALIDELLPMVVHDFLVSLFMIIGIFILSIAVMPISLAFIPFLLVAFYFLRRYYVTASRQIKRLEANSRSPVYSAIPATLEGLPVIRAFRASPRFVDTFSALQDHNTTQWFGFISTARWLGFRLDMGGALMLTFVVFLCTGLAHTLSGATVGLLLSYVMQMIGSLQWAVRQSVESENLFVSVERIIDYATRVPQEPPAVTDIRPPKEWPSKGAITFDKMSLTYPVTQQTVIKDLSVTIASGEKIGLVGRTGAGKSSLLTALFRLVDPSPERSVIIDGLATSDLGLQDLRSSLGIVPQEPHLFLGTLRYNIDPFGQYDDASIWTALEAVELKPKVEAAPEKLDMPVSDGGGNWSVGERQLVCLARAIMKKSKVIVMDEVTANIDVRTDKLIQNTLRSETGLFADATVITIAHRLGSIMDMDRAMVLDKGQLVEFGYPHELLARGPERGWLARMVADMGREAEAAMKDIAYKKEQQRLAAKAAKEGVTVPANETTEEPAKRFGTRTRIVGDRPKMDPADLNMFSIPTHGPSYSLPDNIQDIVASVEFAEDDFEDEAHGAL